MKKLDPETVLIVALCAAIILGAVHDYRVVKPLATASNGRN